MTAIERRRERATAWRLANPEKYAAKYKRWRDKNKEQERLRARKYYWDDTEAARDRGRIYRERHPWKIKAQTLRRDKRKAAASKRKHRINNREKIRAYKRAYDKRRKESDPSYRLMQLIRGRILRALSEQYGEKAVKTMSLLGCSIANLRIYLESRFAVGMSWDNHGSEWQVDHIIPCAIFNLTKPEHQKYCFHFSNLQPLWKLDNQRKHASATPEQKAIVQSL